METLVIDGRLGEGGGQVLRTSLALSVALGRPVRIEHVRGRRKKPGLMRQHLACVQAAAQVCGGGAAGASLGSSEVELHPGGPARAGAYRFAVGSAGSALLVLQTVLPPLLLADGPSEVTLEGGTHNPLAPTADFIAQSFAPQVQRTGGGLALTVERVGFAPAGGGRLVARITPAKAPAPLELLERGAPGRARVEVLLAQLPHEVAQREWRVLQERFHWQGAQCNVREVTDSAGPGNVLQVTLPSASVTTVCTAFGERGLRAERVADLVARDVARHLASDAPVCEHLADQLMLPLALLAGGCYRAVKLSRHTTTNAEVVNTFLPGAVALDLDRSVVSVRASPYGRAAG